MVMGEAIGNTDVAIIGAGPAGYTAAIRIAQQGKKVHIIDKGTFGGTCLHHGCIPTKALIWAASAYHDMKKFSEYGISCDNLKMDMKKTQAWKKEIINKLNAGVQTLLKKNNVKIIQAEAFFEESNKLKLKSVKEDIKLETNALEFNKCIIATGSTERLLKNVQVDGKRIITSYHAIELEEIPESILIIGGGYIGIEISQLLSKIGTKVIIIETQDNILSLVDDDISKVVKDDIIEKGGEIYTNSKVLSCVNEGDFVSTSVETADGIKKFKTTHSLLSIGRIPETSSLKLENTRITLTNQGFIETNENFRTKDKRIYAIGDAIGGVMLAHKAAYEAKVVSDIICGEKTLKDALVPYVIFSSPEISGVGLSEKEATKKGIKYNVKTYHHNILGKVMIIGEKHAFIKILYDDDKNILGINVIGPRAADIIGEAVVAMEMGATIEDLAMIIHPHPTVVEAYGEMADFVLGKGINTID